MNKKSKRSGIFVNKKLRGKRKGKFPTRREETENWGSKIIWKSSSSSDENEEQIGTNKRLSTISENFNPADFNEDHLGENEQKKNDFLAQNDCLESIFHIDSQPSPILRRYMWESNSPILGLHSFLTQSNSPVLSQQQITRSESPILANFDVLENIRKWREARKCQLHQSSQKFSVTSDMIKESDSPKSTNDFNEISIEPICSQDSSSLSSLSTVDASVSGCSNASRDASHCYHQPKKKNKYCKPGGLLHQIQKATHLQASRISLWHHDIYWKKNDFSHVEYIHCQVVNHWKEYGYTLFKCCDTNSDNKNQILVCLGYNTRSVLFDVELVKFIKIFPPFREKLIEHNNETFKLYYNITNILLHKLET